jgi:hypothetical protein
VQTETLKLNIEQLPILIEIKIEGKAKQYVLKTNKDKNGIFINKVELY